MLAHKGLLVTELEERGFGGGARFFLCFLPDEVGLSSVTVGLTAAGFSSVTMGLTVAGFSTTVGLAVGGFSLAAVGSTVVGLSSVTVGFAGGCCVFGSFALATSLSRHSWIDLSKIISMAAARWGFLPEEESSMISRSEESPTGGLNSE